MDSVKMRYRVISTIAAAQKRHKTNVFHQELKLVEFPDGTVRYDIRGWTDDYSKATKGLLLTESEFRTIAQAGLDYINGKKAPGETEKPDAL